MDIIFTFLEALVMSFQKPTLGFLLGGFLIAAMGSRLSIPDSVYRFITFFLLMKIGLRGGMEIRQADLVDLAFPALLAVLIGILIVLLGLVTLAKLPGIKRADALATAGLFGAVSSSSFAAAMVHLEEEQIAYEAWVSALYPFMDIPALVVAILLSKLGKGNPKGVGWKEVVIESLQGAALSALILGLFLGLFTKPESVYEGFYNPLFRGFLSILMIIMGMEAWGRMKELFKVAHWYAIYAFLGPVVHGALAFGLGVIAHYTTGFSQGGVVLLSILAASSSDISGPPTLRAGIPSANPSAFIGSSTSVGTPICIVFCIPLFTELSKLL